MTASILIVEDEEPIQILLTYNLQAEGFRIRATANGEDVAHLVNEERPDLIEALYGEYVFRTEKPTTPTIFLRSGVDNVLNHTAFTLGGGIRWRDDDLKYLLGSIPIGK